jgi:uncharacterized membrane protein HdeD (DUF308 family)
VTDTSARTSSSAFDAARRRDDPAGALLGQAFPWWAVLITGLLGMGFGIAVLAWPDVSLRIMAALAGIWLLLSGIARILAAFLPGAGSIVRHLFTGIVGVVLLIAGLLCLQDLATRLSVLALLFTVSWMLSGIAELIMGLQHDGAARYALIAVGLLSLLAGVVFLVTPELSLATLVILTGVSSLVVGLGEVVAAFVLRRLRRQQAVGGLPVTAGRPA